MLHSIGIMECWKNGRMGSGVMGFWFAVSVVLRIYYKIDNILLKTNIPVFHYSIIP